jgi:TRAP-type mannitol/chloroaromatic compound transport system substrate-binding protein
MGRCVISLLLVSVLWVHSGLFAKAETARAVATSQASASQKPTLKEQIIQIPTGVQVEVRLLNKERLRGRLGEVSDEGFSVQIAKGNQIETRKVAFSDVKSVKEIRKRHTAAYVFLGVAMTLGLLLAVGFAIDAARGGR